MERKTEDLNALIREGDNKGRKTGRWLIMGEMTKESKPKTASDNRLTK